MQADETNQLLREIRDILASQDKKYDDHLKKVQDTYAQQIQIAEQHRKKHVRVILMLLLIFFAGIALVVYSMK